MRSLWLLLALAACGDDSNRHIADAPPGGFKDAPADVAPNTPVTVTVAGAPVNTRAYFQNADSSVVKAAALDATGTASAVMDAGGFVTVVAPNQAQGLGLAQSSLYTWAGVKPGDHLVIADPPFPSGNTTVNVTLPLDTTHGAVSYKVSSTCSDSTTVTPPGGSGAGTTFTSALTFFACPTADLEIVGLDGNGAVAVYLTKLDQTLTDQGTLDYSASTYTVAPARTYTISNTLDPEANVDIYEQYRTAKGGLYQFDADYIVVGNPATGSLTLPPLPAGGTEILRVSVVGVPDNREVGEWTQTQGPYTLDWGAHMLQGFDAAHAPALDVTAHAVTWGTVASALAPDYSGTGIFAARSGQNWSWQAFGPSGDHVALPVVPTDLGDFNIAATDDTTVEFVAVAKSPGGWDAARPAIMAGPPLGIGASGQIEINFYQTQPSEAAHLRARRIHPTASHWQPLRR